jgi:hypothetical protein
MARRAYDGDPLDGTAQYITERPELEEEADEVAYATDPEPEGESTAENVPMPGDGEGCQFPGCTKPTDRTYCADCRAATQGGED